ncbi:MAG TPA: hypothetical protein VMR21_17270 [Vicinamibacteria bacterium]|nr:hypothetical protein [Vicinamibacteria bacterium]
MRARLSPRRTAGTAGPWPWIRYFAGRLLQVTGLVLALVAATAFFGTPSTIAMLRMMLVGVLLFVPGWLLARKDPRSR